MTFRMDSGFHSNMKTKLICSCTIPTDMFHSTLWNFHIIIYALNYFPFKICSFRSRVFNFVYVNIIAFLLSKLSITVEIDVHIRRHNKTLPIFVDIFYSILSRTCVCIQSYITYAYVYGTSIYKLRMTKSKNTYAI